MNKRLMVVFLGTMAVSSVNAGELARALSAGKVCETSDGYIRATPGHEGEMAALLDKVNTKRQKVYSDIAAREGISPADVAIENTREERAKNPGKFCR